MEKGLEIEIDQYINGKLSGGTLAAFKKKLAADKTLQTHVNQHQKIHKLLLKSKQHQNQKVELPAFMDQLANEFIVKAPNKQTKTVYLKPEIDVEASSENNRKPFIKWLIPAATLAAAAIVLLMFFPISQTDMPTYANNYYQPYEASFTVKGEANDLTKAGNLYQSENWAAALEIFAKYPNNYKAQLAKGNCEYQLGLFNKALLTFNKVADSKSDYAGSGAWFTALSHLQKENKLKAIFYLKNVPPNSIYHKQAQQLIKKLD